MYNTTYVAIDGLEAAEIPEADAPRVFIYENPGKKGVTLLQDGEIHLTGDQIAQAADVLTHFKAKHCG